MKGKYAITIVVLSSVQIALSTTKIVTPNDIQQEGKCSAPSYSKNHRVSREGKEPTKEWWTRTAGVNHNDVHKLDATNFEQFRKDQPSALIMFYAKWCYYSQIGTTPFAMAAEQLQSYRYPGALGAIDCDEARYICQQYEIKSFPTFLYFTPENSKGLPYTFERKTNDFVSFMVGKSFRNMG